MPRTQLHGIPRLDRWAGSAVDDDLRGPASAVPQHQHDDSGHGIPDRTGDPDQQPINEQAGFVKANQQKELIKYCRASLKSINSDLEKVNQQIARLIETDEI